MGDININPIEIAEDLANGEANSPGALLARIAILEARLKEAEGKMLLMHVELAVKRAFKAELESRALAAEARVEAAEKALRGIEVYMASEESPLYHLWESGDICAYDDNPCDTWEQVLLELRNFSIDPAIIGYGTEWDAVTIYRKILAALSDKEVGK